MPTTFTHLTKITTLAIVVVAISANHQTRAQTPRTIVVRAARMLDPVAGRVVPNATIVVSGDRVQSLAGSPPLLPRYPAGRGRALAPAG